MRVALLAVPLRVAQALGVVARAHAADRDHRRGRAHDRRRRAAARAVQRGAGRDRGRPSQRVRCAQPGKPSNFANAEKIGRLHEVGSSGPVAMMEVFWDHGWAAAAAPPTRGSATTCSVRSCSEADDQTHATRSRSRSRTAARALSPRRRQLSSNSRVRARLNSDVSRTRLFTPILGAPPRSSSAATKSTSRSSKARTSACTSSACAQFVRGRGSVGGGHVQRLDARVLREVPRLLSVDPAAMVRYRPASPTISSKRQCSTPFHARAITDFSTFTGGYDSMVSTTGALANGLLAFAAVAARGIDCCDPSARAPGLARP